MARSDAYKGSEESPVKKYLEWASNDKCFSSYNKETGLREKITVPLKFVHLDELATIRGYIEINKVGQRIYSNEVRSTKNEPFVVKTKSGELASGLYSEIKEKVNALGGNYNTSLYAYLDGEVVGIFFKGSALSKWADFSRENKKTFLGSYIEVTGALAGKKGAVSFTTPIFQAGGAIDKAVSESAEEAYDQLQAFLKSRKDTDRSDVMSHPEEPVHAIFTEAPDQTFAKVEDNPLPF
jgi:hypothetical protein